MQIVIRNVGTATLNSFKVNYKIDNGVPIVYNWVGSLASGTATSITLPSSTFSYGKHTFTAYTSAPNGGVDGFKTNDTIQSGINIVQTGAALPFTEGFEETFPPPDWGLSNPDGDLTWAPTTVAKSSGSRSALMLNYYNPFYGTTDYMATPVLDITSVNNPYLSFQVAYQLQTGYPSDTLLVLVSTDCGNTYAVLYKKWGSVLATVAGTTTNPFIPSGTTQWRNEAYLLPPSVASSSTAVFIFMNKGGAGNNLYLDDIIIAGANMTASVSIAQTAGVNPTCSGSSATFTATPANGGTAPSYQWKIDGVNAGTNSATFTSTALANGQVVTCVMTSNLAGVTGSPATSNSITMTVNPTVTPTVASSINSGTNPMCAGASVTFKATPTNGGTTPGYQWKVNGVNAGTNSATFTSTALTNGQVVTCVMTSNAACASTTTATSAGITITVNPIPTTPVISQAGSVLTSSSATGNQWYLNGTLIPGATNQTHTVVQNGNYTVIVTKNNCSSNASTPVNMSTVGIDGAKEEVLVNVYPNPNNGNFTISFNSSDKSNHTLELSNSLGQIVYREVLNDFNGVYSKELSIAGYGCGVYMLSITNEQTEIKKKIIVY